MFMLSVWPIVLAATPLGSEASSNFSIWNDEENGLSALRLRLENAATDSGDPKYNITSDISSLNVLNRLNQTGVVAIMGPSSPFDMTETISLILFLIRGGSLIICDDFGTGNDVLDPIFSALEGWDDLSSTLGMDLPSITELMAGGDSDEEEAGSPEVSIMNLIGSVLKRIGFNGSALMDAGVDSFTDSYAKPMITDFAESSLTENVERLQLEFATIISLKVNHTYTDDAGEEQWAVDWMPVQKLSMDLLGDLIEEHGQGLAGAAAEASANVTVGLPFFPFYTSKSSWIESDFDKADVEKAGSGVESDDFYPDPDEWSGARFSPVLYLPMIGGYIYFIGDPSIFINRWTERPTENDNMIFAMNLFDHATSRMDDSSDPIMILFDEGHTYHGLRDPLLYTSNYLRIITSLSMFPLLAPFVPWVIGVSAYRFIPRPERLRPLLLTKRRRKRGVSDFERRLRRIKREMAYDEALKILYDRLIDVIRERRGETVISPNDIASLVVEVLPNFKERQTARLLREIRVEIQKPTMKLKLDQFADWMRFLKALIDLIPRQ